MSNRFWAGSSSEDEDEQSKSSESSSEDERQPVQLNQKVTDKKFALAFDESDSESEDEQREVKSNKDRTWDSIREGITKINNARKNNDWPLIQTEFNNVNKLIERKKALIVQHGMPGIYIKMLQEMEDHVSAALKDKEAVKKMKPLVTRALNQMKSQVRKHNEGYKDEITDCRTNPEKYQEKEPEKVAKKKKADSDSEDDSDEDDSEDDEDESEEDSEDEKPKAKAVVKAAAKPVSKFVADDDSDDSLFEKEEDEASSSESEDERKQLTGRAKWLKKKPTKAEEDKKKKEAEEDRRKKEEKEKAKKIVKVKAIVEVKEDKKAEIEKLTEEELEKRVSELVASRGRKNMDNREVLRQLEVLVKATRVHGPAKEIPVIMHFLSAMFDTQRGIDEYMDHQQWSTSYRALLRILNILESKKDLVLEPIGTDELVASFNKLDVRSAEEQEKKASKTIHVVGNIESFVLRLEDEYNKALQQINPHTQEYVIRLADEAALVELEESAFRYYERVNDFKASASVALFMVEHLYYKHDNHAAAVQQAHAFNKKWGNYRDLHPASKGKIAAGLARDVEKTHPAAYTGNPTASSQPVNYSAKLETLCNFIYKYGDDRMKTRALLCSVFHLALHERYYVARDLFLMSHIQDYIERAEIKTQILFNRTLVQLGLCAFRNGLFQKAHDCLQVICSGRVKELLAQGSSRSQDKDSEQERVERRRQMPYHMHINPDLLESCHLISAMILELPLLAKINHAQANGSTPSSVYISRQLRKYMDTYSKQTFTGPPETVREHIVAATRSILKGDWNTANNLIKSLEVWNLLPANGGEKAKEMLQVRIREEAIRCYILSNQYNYDSISLNLLSSMFEIQYSEVKKILCHMIFNKEIAASLENNGSALVFYKIDPSPLQQMCLTAAEKLSQLLESNERIVDSLIGVYGYKDDWNVKNKQGDGQQQQGQQQGQGSSAYGLNKRRGFRSSRPVVAKGTRMATSGRHSSRGGSTSTGHQNNRNVWQNKNHNNRRQNNNNNNRNNKNNSNNNNDNQKSEANNNNNGGNQSD